MITPYLTHLLRTAVLLLALCAVYAAVDSRAADQGGPMPISSKSGNSIVPVANFRGRSLLTIDNPERMERSQGANPFESVLTSSTLELGIPANEIVISWNAETPVG